MTGRQALAAGALLGALGVGLGAFGAHALAGRLSPADLQVYETGARYQMVHAVALVALGGWLDRGSRPRLEWAARAWIAGVTIFSGSLYLLVLTGHRWFGAVTPLGGASLIAGWLLVLADAAGSRRAAG
jgi:uncharacterized membrane protein YgdD (TMEM256/DUF423 family)